ncbi:hypothetical protein Tco_0560796 [Tanacetum coccineum]
MSHINEETPTVELAVSAPSAREPASSNERNRSSAEEYEILESNVRLKIKLETDEWIKDSGCSRHMTGNKNLFSTYKAVNGGIIVFGSNTKSKIIGKGNGYLTKGRKTKPKTTKLSTEWKSVRRRSKIKAKESIKPKSQQKSQIVKVNPDRVKVSSEKLKQKIQLEGPHMPNP